MIGMGNECISSIYYPSLTKFPSFIFPLCEKAPSYKAGIAQSLIREMMQQKNWTMKDIADEANLPVITIRRLYEGTSKNARLRVFQKIFRLYCRVCNT